MSDLQFGHCGTCKFTERINPKGHWMGEYYKLRCVRFPPHQPPPSEIWSEQPGVSSVDGCWEWQQRETEEVKK